MVYCEFCDFFNRDENGLYCCRYLELERKAFDINNLLKRCPLENETGEINYG